MEGAQRRAGALFLVTGATLVAHIVVGLPVWLTVPGGLLACGPVPGDTTKVLLARAAHG